MPVLDKLKSVFEDPVSLADAALLHHKIDKVEIVGKVVLGCN